MIKLFSAHELSWLRISLVHAQRISIPRLNLIAIMHLNEPSKRRCPEYSKGRRA